MRNGARFYCAAKFQALFVCKIIFRPFRQTLLIGITIHREAAPVSHFLWRVSPGGGLLWASSRRSDLPWCSLVDFLLDKHTDWSVCCLRGRYPHIPRPRSDTPKDPDGRLP